MPVKKSITSYIDNLGNTAGPVGRFTAEIIDVPLKIGSIGVRGIANTFNVGKNVIARETKVIGNVLSKSTRVVANAISSNDKKTRKPRKSKTTKKTSK